MEFGVKGPLGPLRTILDHLGQNRPKWSKIGVLGLNMGFGDEMSQKSYYVEILNH